MGFLYFLCKKKTENVKMAQYARPNTIRPFISHSKKMYFSENTVKNLPDSLHEVIFLFARHLITKRETAQNAPHPNTTLF